MGAFAGIIGANLEHSTNRVTPQRWDGVRQVISQLGANLTEVIGEDGLICHNQSYTQLDGLVSDEHYTTVLVGRIDNREDIRTTISSDPHSNDAQLLHKLYECYGAEGLEKVTGDFTTAIHDKRNQTFLIVRGPIGSAPVYYKNTDGRFMVATTTQALVALSPDIAADLSRDVLEDYALSKVSFATEQTGYKNIEHLGAGCRLIYANGNVQTYQYHTIRPYSGRIDDPCGQFLALFQQSIKRRLRGANAVGTTLSGGLDSSAITCTLDRFFTSDMTTPLAVISSIFDGQNGPDEREYIRAVHEGLGEHAQTIEIDSSHIAAFDNIAQRVKSHSRPFLIPNAAIGAHPVVALRKHNSNINVMFHGHGGDEVAYDSAGYLYELAQQMNIAKLWRETNMTMLESEHRSKLLLVMSLLIGMNPIGQRINRRVQTVKNMLSKGSKNSIAGSEYLSDDLLARHDKILVERHSLTPLPDYIKKMSLSHRGHYRLLTSPLQAYGMEALYHETSSSGLDVQYPFWDSELVAFCLALPGSEKWQNGRARSIIRRSLHDIMPEKVLTRENKFHFNGYLARSMRANDGLEVMADAIIEGKDRISPYFNVNAIQSAFDSFAGKQDTPPGQTLIALWRATILSIWINEHAKIAKQYRS